MRKRDREDLECWIRKMEFYDQDDDGIGEISVSFKIRDEEERMKRIYAAMTARDARRIAADYAGGFYPCEDFADDWNDPDSGFGVTFGWDGRRGEIWVAANFRT